MIKKQYKLIAALLLLAGCFYIAFEFSSKPRSIAIEYTKANIPCINAFIQNKPFTFRIDLGSDAEASIYSDKLKILHKDYIGTITIGDAFGNVNKESNYEVSDLLLGNLRINTFKTRTRQRKKYASENIETDTQLEYPFDDSKITLSYDGDLGRGILSKENLLFDCPKSKLYFVPTFQQAVKKRLISSSALRVPFAECKKNAIILNVSTDMGILPFVLDTGASHSVIASTCFKTLPDPGSLWETPNLSIGGNNYAPRKLVILDLHPNLPFRGVLGMDFFHEHKIYIDWGNHELYID